MEATEFRIGNWVKLKATKVIYDITTILFENEWWLNSDFIYHRMTECEGVLLSSEILEKCGFKRREENNSRNVFWIVRKGRQFEIATDFLTIEQFPTNLHEINKQGMIHTMGQVQHLHQLQNIIFALVGEELNFTP